MPGKGRIESRDYTADEAAALRAFFPIAHYESSPSLENSDTAIRGERAAREDNRSAMELLGSATFDIFLNDDACWRNVPEKVWSYTIGGYQVIKKWLSYRERELLKRPLTPDEAREVTHMTRRIAALILLQPRLDQNYQTVKAATGQSWKTES